MIGLTELYYLVGAVMAVVALLTACDAHHPRRVGSSLFWGLYATIFIVGEQLPLWLVGIVVVALSILGGFGAVKVGHYQALQPEQAQHSQQSLGNRLFIPALAIPVCTLVIALGFSWWPQPQWLDSKNLTLIGLGIACLVSFGIALYLTKESPRQGGLEAKRLLEAMGWAFLLPHLLATLGLVFSQAGVGQVIAELSRAYLALDSRLSACAAYAIAMALMTIVMGNAFAAFPVITAGLGLPLLIEQHQANPAVMAALGMFSGYCGTLLTPMAANFNIVPVALLELKQQNAVIKAQAPTALLLLVCNIVFLYCFAF